MNPNPSITIVLPACNEAASLKTLLPEIRRLYPQAEIILVDDGSIDDTARIGEEAGVRVHSHPYRIGNGAAVKTGARLATGDIVLFMDADGQHDPAYIQSLLDKLAAGYDMVVGARLKHTHASLPRRWANTLYNRLASFMVGQPIADLTSGLRAVRAAKLREFLYLLPNGFSYPTTVTMAFFRAGYPVAYVPIEAGVRQGQSHIHWLKDGVRFFIIIFKIGTLYSPLKIFVPASLGFFSIGLSHYLHTYFTIGRFTNMSALLFITSVVVFLIGLVSEQITSLMYRQE